jgi:molecular chaperone GrpE (heat shock protein)
MKNWLRFLFRHDREFTVPEPAIAADRQPSETMLQLENEIQALHLEQAEYKRKIEVQAAEISRLKARQGQLIEMNVTSQMEALLSEMAGPASQILAQADLLENQGKPINAYDILSVAKRMVRALGRHGMTIEGKVGDTASFDPEKHIPIHPEQMIQPGETVKIRFAGILYGEKRLNKAIVERENECQDD